MTVSSRNTRAVVRYEFNKSTNKYIIPFPFLQNDQYIKVYIRNVDGSIVILELDNEYSILIEKSLNNIYGYMSLKDGIDTSKFAYIIIMRDIPKAQNVKFSSNAIVSTTTENAFDTLTMIVQDQNVYDYCLHVPIDDVLIDEEGKSFLELPNAKDRNGFLCATNGKFFFKDVKYDGFKDGKYISIDQENHINCTLTGSNSIKIDLSNAMHVDVSDTDVVSSEPISFPIIDTSENAITRKWSALSTTRVFGIDTFIAITKTTGSPTIAISQDYGSTWTVKDIEVNNQDGTPFSFENVTLSSINGGNGIFIIIANSTKASNTGFVFFTSDGGKKWNKKEEGSSPVFTNTSFVEIAHNNISGTFVIISNERKPQYRCVDNGRSWASVSKAPGDWRSLTYGDTNFVGISTDSSVSLISYDAGSNWFTYNTDIVPTGKASNICYGNYIFMFANYVESWKESHIYRSNDGIIWEKCSTISGEVFAITYGNNGLFYCSSLDIGFSGHIWSSNDCGITWDAVLTPDKIGDGHRYKSLQYANGRVIAIEQDSNKCCVLTVGIKLLDVCNKVIRSKY